MATLNIKYEDKEYLFDMEELDTEQMAVIERSGVPSLSALEEGITRGELLSVRAAFWLMLVQNGQEGQRIERVSFKPLKFIKALGQASREAAEAEGK